MNSKPGTNQPNWLDRDPEETARREEMISLEDKIENFFEGRATVIDEEARIAAIIANPYPTAMVPKEPDDVPAT